MNINKKAIISVILVMIICFTLILTVSYSDPVSLAIGGLTGVSGMGLFGSVSSFMGADVSYNGISEDPYNMMWTASQDDPVTIEISEIHKGTGTTGDEYDYIVLDSQGYNDIATAVIENWLHDNNISDNSSGTITSPQNFEGLPLNTQIGATTVDPQAVGNTYRFGANNLYWTIEIIRKNKGTYRLYHNGQLIYQGGESSIYTAPVSYFMILKWESGTSVSCAVQRANAGYTETTYLFANALTPATNINWSSSTIDTTAGTDYTSPKIKIPSAISGLTPLFTAEDFIKALAAVALAQEINQVIIEDASAPPVPPTPTPTPLPTMPLGEVPYDQFIDTWGQHIIDNQETGNDTLENIDTNIQTGNDSLENIDTNIEDAVDTLDSIDTNIGTTNGILGQIRDWMQSGFTGITNLLNQILSGVQSLVQSIVNATENLIAGILNQIPIAFQSAWNTLKQHVSIWHYVVEWIQSITTPFTWIWGIASGTSYYIILPVYASLAGAVVLALYKKFGR